jgi:hypothetical protein
VPTELELRKKKMTLGSRELWREREDSSGQQSWDKGREGEGRPLRRAKRYDPFLPFSYLFLEGIPTSTTPRVASRKATEGEDETVGNAVAGDRLLRIN